MSLETAYAHVCARVLAGTRAYALARISGSLYESIGAEATFELICEADRRKLAADAARFTHGLTHDGSHDPRECSQAAKGVDANGT